MKKLLLLTLSFFICLNVFSLDLNINENSIRAYRDAKEYFQKQMYGEALSKCEDAITFRKQLSESHSKILETSLNARKVQKAGDSITEILKVLEEREEKESINIIQYYFSKKGEAFFDNSISRMLEYISQIKTFPEAQALIGDIYRLEGEYDFSEQYYLMAIENAGVLDVPQEKYEIYFKLAKLSSLKKDYEQMEVRLLTVLTEDKTYTDKALFNAMIYTLSSNNEQSIKKFFELYRANNYYAQDAYTQLCDYYQTVGETEKALEFSMLTVLTDFTRIVEIISERDIEFAYTDLTALLEKAAEYPDLMNWCNKHEVWKEFNNFASILIKKDYKITAESLLKILSSNIPDEYWQKNAVLIYEKLKSNQ